PSATSRSCRPNSPKSRTTGRRRPRRSNSSKRKSKKGCRTRRSGRTSSTTIRSGTPNTRPKPKRKTSASSPNTDAPLLPSTRVKRGAMSVDSAATAPVARTPRGDGGGWLGSLNNAFGGSGATWLLVPPILFRGLMLMVPLGYLVVLAFEHGSAGKTGFGEAYGDHLFWASMWRTFVLAAIVSFFTLVFGTLYAIAIAAAPKWLAIVLLVALFTI